MMNPTMIPPAIWAGVCFLRTYLDQQMKGTVANTMSPQGKKA